jgi:hypothetical protein
MQDSTKKTLLKYLLFFVVIIIIAVLVYFFSKGFLFKKESFSASDNYGSDFDYVLSFIKNIIGV